MAECLGQHASCFLKGRYAAQAYGDSQGARIQSPQPYLVQPEQREDLVPVAVAHGRRGQGFQRRQHALHIRQLV